MKKYFLNFSIFLFLCLLLVVVEVGQVRPARAETSRVFRPYLNDEIDGQQAALRHDPRRLSDWTRSPRAGIHLLKHFFDIGVLDDYSYNVFTKSPLLVVGPGFYRLSRLDQNRVAGLVDFVFHGTQKKPGTIFIADHDTGKVIGLYTAEGLQLE